MNVKFSGRVKQRGHFHRVQLLLAGRGLPDFARRADKTLSRLLLRLGAPVDQSADHHEPERPTNYFQPKQ